MVWCRSCLYRVRWVRLWIPKKGLKTDFSCNLGSGNLIFLLELFCVDLRDATVRLFTMKLIWIFQEFNLTVTSTKAIPIARLLPVSLVLSQNSAPVRCLGLSNPEPLPSHMLNFNCQQHVVVLTCFKTDFYSQKSSRCLSGCHCQSERLYFRNNSTQFATDT